MRWLGALVLVVGCSFEHGSLGPHGDDGTSGMSPDADVRSTVDASSATACERTCPSGSTCSNGHCQPPAGATSCTKASDCSGSQVCDLYVVGGSLVGYCTDPFPTQNSGTSSCSSVGYTSSCPTGICAQDSSGHTRCLTPCENGNDSTCSGDFLCKAVAEPQQIEGVSTAGQFGCLDTD